jgi:hypothetical protein
MEPPKVTGRARPILGIVGAAILLLSSASHSILGWRGLSAELAGTNTPPDLRLGLMIGWQFGGVAMLVLGILMLSLFMRRLRGEAVPSYPAVIVAIAYLLFGLWAYALTTSAFFLFAFTVPAILLMAAVPRPTRRT